MKILCFLIFYFFTFLLTPIHAQDKASNTVPVDSFFLLKKKGLWGLLGKSITTDDTHDIFPQKVVNQSEKFKGMKIRNIYIENFPLFIDMRDSSLAKKNFGVRMAAFFHRTTRMNTIKKYLFFKVNDEILPFQIADNIQLLRQLLYLKDVQIIIYPTSEINKVDVAVFTNDQFSILADVDINSNGGLLKLYERNLGGFGNELRSGIFYDKNRKPGFGSNIEYTQRNILGKFIDWTNGYSTYTPAFNYGYNEELKLYSTISKPLVSRYTQITGELNFEYHRNIKKYNNESDSLFHTSRQYTFINSDFWLGYNFGAKNGRRTDSYHRIRHFVAGRIFNHYFLKVPEIYTNNYNYNYANIKGLLMAYSLFKQNIFSTQYIYGFGRNESLPEGINTSLIIGVTKKQGYTRNYLGIDLSESHLPKSGSFYEYIFRAGGFIRNKKMEDIDILGSFNFITPSYHLNSKWLLRNFINTSVTSQINSFLNSPLFVQSFFGMPYFNNGNITGNFRISIHDEAVFYHLKNYAGFKFAPFIFADAVSLKPIHQPYSISKIYSDLGGGIRTRNENLIFGTIELKAYYLPVTSNPSDKNFKIEFNTNIRFQYNSNFIKAPDFISVN